MTNFWSKKRIPEAVTLELTICLFKTIIPSVVMASIFAMIGGLIGYEAADPVVYAIVIAGTSASIAKLGLVIGFRREPSGLRSAQSIRRWGDWFSVLTVAFAVCVGSIGARSFAIGSPNAQMLVTCMLFGLCSGLVAHTAVRLQLAIVALAVAACPVILAAAVTGGVEHRVIAVSFTLFLVASFESARQMFLATSEHIATRQAMADLARVDPLTGLPNRLGLAEGFAAVADGPDMIAIHCLDLDGFKPVNDRYGHPTGDLLLKTLALRLVDVLRPGDTAARLGGDEFVVIQTAIHLEAEADLFARRLLRTITAPYDLDGIVIKIGVSLGYATAESDRRDLAGLVAAADKALYRVKQAGGGVGTDRAGLATDDARDAYIAG